MIRTIAFLFLITLGIDGFSQIRVKEDIIISRDYYYGTGISQDENRAREEAIAEICEMVAINVSSKFELNVREENDDYNEKATSLIQTYTTGTLRDVESIRTVQPDGEIELFCYIPKSEVNEIFNERIQFVRSLRKNADENRTAGNLAMALKNYYFALILLKSVPAERLGQEHNDLVIKIPQIINEIIQDIDFKVKADELISPKERHIEFTVAYKEQPVSSLHFRFWDGSQLTGVGQVRDGKANIILYGPSVDFDDLKIFIQYEYYNARRELLAVEQLWDLVSRPEFNVQKTIALANSKGEKVNIDRTGSLSLRPAEDISVEENILENTISFINLLSASSKEDILTTYGNDDFLKKKIEAYMDYNRPIPLSNEVSADVNVTRHGYEVRKIPVIHDYPSLHKQSNEYLVLDFDESGWLVDFNLCITDDLYDKFVMQATYGKDWGNRQEIIKFIEKYRTAFFTRDIETIDLMFADEALILIGRKIQPKKKSMNEIAYAPLPGQPGFEQIQLTKQQYLTRQKQVFNHQNDIFIDFSTFEIKKKNNAPDVYGVEMRQNYSSTTYADEGYLFLLIDFREQYPLIYIRAWQPNEWDTNHLINTSNFRIYK